MPMPSLPTSSASSASIQIGTDAGGNLRDEDEVVVGGKWEDEEERRFYEECPDLRRSVPSSFLGLEGGEAEDANRTAESSSAKEVAEERKQRDAIEAKELEHELQRLSLQDGNQEADIDAPILQNGEEKQ